LQDDKGTSGRRIAAAITIAHHGLDGFLAAVAAELPKERGHVAPDSFRQAGARLFGDGAYHLAEVKARITEEKVAEDARRRHEEEVTAFLLQDAIHLLDRALELPHKLEGELGISGIAGCERSLEHPKLSHPICT
jgi:hypothetical protein